MSSSYPSSPPKQFRRQPSGAGGGSSASKPTTTTTKADVPSCSFSYPRTTTSSLITLATCNLNQWALDFDGNVKRIQQERFGEDRTIASTLQNPDMAKLADAFGVKYWHADSPESLRPALGESINHDGPCLVEVTVDAMPNPWPFLRLPQVRGN